MPLNHIDLDVIRLQQGFVFYMEVKTTKQTVRVFVADEALDILDDCDDDDLQEQLQRDLTDFEAIACEKYNHGQVGCDGLIVISQSDVAGRIH